MYCDFHSSQTLLGCFYVFNESIKPKYSKSFTSASHTAMPQHNNKTEIVKSQQEKRLHYKIVFFVQGHRARPLALSVFICQHTGHKLLCAIMGYNTGVKQSSRPLGKAQVDDPQMARTEEMSACLCG